MKKSDLRLKETDIATAVAYFGTMELLDFIGAPRIEEYLVSAVKDSDYIDAGEESCAKLHLHRHSTSAKIQLGGCRKITIKADFADNEGNEVTIDVQMDRAFRMLLR